MISSKSRKVWPRTLAMAPRRSSARLKVVMIADTRLTGLATAMGSDGEPQPFVQGNLGRPAHLPGGPGVIEAVPDLLPRPVRVIHRARFSAEMSRDAPVERVEGCFGAGSDIEDGVGVIGGDGEGEQVRADDVVHVDVVASLHPIAPDVGLLPR